MVTCWQQRLVDETLNLTGSTTKAQGYPSVYENVPSYCQLYLDQLLQAMVCSTLIMVWVKGQSTSYFYSWMFHHSSQVIAVLDIAVQWNCQLLLELHMSCQFHITIIYSHSILFWRQNDRFHLNIPHMNRIHHHCKF